MATNNNDKKISQLPLADPLSGLELVPVVQNGRNKRVTIADIFSLAESSANSSIVNRVNGQTGEVVLTPADIGAATEAQGTKADTSEQVANKNEPLGYAGLDGAGKIPVSLLPSTSLQLAGSWDASTNTPTLLNGSGNQGEFFIVTVGGTVNFGDGPVTFNAGDSVYYGADGKYFRSVNSSDVLSVNSKTGAVVIDKSDVGLSNVDNTSDVNKPVSFPTQTQLNLKASISTLSSVAFSGSYADLTNKPLIPSLTSVESDITELQNHIAYLEGLINLITNDGKISLIARETPLGQINGINKNFTLAHTPIIGSEQVFLNGMLQEAGTSGDYTISGQNVVFNAPPKSSWTVFVSYLFAVENEPLPVNHNALQWSSSEQIYPFEKSNSGATLYCKEIDVGALTNRSGKSVAHGISNYSSQKIHNVSGTIYNTSGSDCVSLNSLAYGGNFCLLDAHNITVYTPNSDCTAYRCKVRLVYSK